jgi:hypothetical protein
MKQVNYKISIKQTGCKSYKAEDFTKIRALSKVAPTLKKYQATAHSYVQSTVKQIRATYKAPNYYVVSISRMIGKELIKQEYTVASRMEVYPKLKELKSRLNEQVRVMRAQRKRGVIVDNKPYYAGRDVNVHGGVLTKKQGRCYLESGVFMKVYKRKLREDIFKSKSPKDAATHYVGVEIEFISKGDRDDIADALYEAGLSPYVNLKGDGSVRTDDTHRHAHELCIIATESEIKRVVNEACAILIKIGSKVNKSCGLHVHLDMRNRDAAKSFSNLVSMQNILYRMVPASRKANTYCKPTRGKTYRILDERYHGINSQSMRRHNTLECRIHSGTIDSLKINNWIELLIASANHQEIKRAPTTAKGAQKMLGLSDALTDYIAARLAKFATQHDGTAPVVEEESEAA